MTLTANSELELAFDPNLLPSHLHSTLPDGIHLRPLSSTDYSRSHLDVLRDLTTVSDPGEAAWKDQFKAMVALSNTYYPIVLVDKDTDHIVAVGTLFIEKKFIRGLASVGHIEDIAVSKKVQGKGLGKRVIEALTTLSEALGAYKVILDCDPKNEGFYVKCGYENKGLEMAKYK